MLSQTKIRDRRTGLRLLYVAQGRFAGFVICLVGFVGTANWVRAQTYNAPELSPSSTKPASVQEMIDSVTDVWGDAAMRQPNGASYEFFKDLLPPVRWVTAEFRHYP